MGYICASWKRMLGMWAIYWLSFSKNRQNKSQKRDRGMVLAEVRVQPWRETPQHLQKTPGIHLLPTAHSVSRQLQCIVRNTLSGPRWISECSEPGSAGAYWQMPCLPARSNNGVCLYKVLETHCLKGEGFIMFFSALGKKQTNKKTLIICKPDFWFQDGRWNEQQFPLNAIKPGNKWMSVESQAQKEEGEKLVD